jgi:hypothetical protein
MRLEQCYCLVSEDAVRTAAVSDYLLDGVQLAEARFHLLDRKRKSARNVALLIFAHGAHVQEDGAPFGEPAHQVIAREWLQVFGVAHICFHQAINLRKLLLADLAQCLPEREHG